MKIRKKQVSMNQWAKAMESGDYEQIDGVLAESDGHSSARYCCLGVFCKVGGAEFSTDGELELALVGPDKNEQAYNDDWNVRRVSGEFEPDTVTGVEFDKAVLPGRSTQLKLEVAFQDEPFYDYDTGEEVTPEPETRTITVQKISSTKFRSKIGSNEWVDVDNGWMSFCIHMNDSLHLPFEAIAKVVRHFCDPKTKVTLAYGVDDKE